MQLIDIIKILDNTEQLGWEKEAYQQALNDELDIEMYFYKNLHVFGNAEQKAFYAKKWQETYEKYCDYDPGYPEKWEKAGYTKEEWEEMGRVHAGDIL